MSIDLTPSIKAAVLVEALPWLERFQGATIVVKFGGNAMVDDALIHAFAQDVVYLRLSGLRPVVVHGGGAQITPELSARGIASEFIGGYRVTTSEVMTVVREVLVNQVQKQLVDAINEHADLAVGISGDEQHTLVAERREAMIDGQSVDIGFVGDVIKVNPELLKSHVEAGCIPVMSTVGLGEDGHHYNVNADTAASAIAVELEAEKLVILTDVAGLYRNWPDTTSVISEITVDELESMLLTLESGMVPKMEACARAVRGGIPRATVVDGRVSHCLLLEVFTDEGTGTMVVPSGDSDD
jgi:acetylglutamate kinase